jgi:hypothetical protein
MSLLCITVSSKLSSVRTTTSLSAPFDPDDEPEPDPDPDELDPLLLFFPDSLSLVISFILSSA